MLRMGWLRKDLLLDLGMFFQVAVAFACGLFEGAAYENPNMVVLGHSGIAVWMILCGLLMPKAPLRAALSALLCVLMWPLAYWVDLQIFGYQPMPLSRLLVWVLPLVILGVWTYILNNRVLAMYVTQQRAEDVGSYVLDTLLGSRRHGRSLASEAQDARPRGGHQADSPGGAAGQHRTPGGHAAETLRARSPGDGQPALSPHGRALRFRPNQRTEAFYYVMELLEGIDLQTMVEKYGPMHPGRVVDILHQTCQSLEEAHRAGLVHRDIKPRNILLCKLGLQYDFTKVLDFGLVKSLRPGDQTESLLTRDGVTTGTPGLPAAGDCAGLSRCRWTGGSVHPGLRRLLPVERPHGF